MSVRSKLRSEGMIIQNDSKEKLISTFSHACTSSQQLVAKSCQIVIVCLYLAFVTGNSSLEPLLKGLLAQIHIDWS